MTALIFAVDYTDANGRNHKAGANGNLTEPEAKNLVYRGLARLAPAKADPKPEETSGDADTPADTGEGPATAGKKKSNG